MKCKHVNKDAPENSICEDCIAILNKFMKDFKKQMKGGNNQDGRKR